MINDKFVRTKVSRYIFWCAAFALGAFMLLAVVSFVWIHSSVKKECQIAKLNYGGDCVEALIDQLDDESQSFQSRNRAIYALGQLADDRALPTLKSYYTGKIPEKEPLNEDISQYELKKAITWCEKGNTTSWMYWNQGNW